ncbi:carbamoyl-phosphate synthase small subunit [Catenisphaera adipataccumulans]|jgi:carbamoyl-phosphate synthase small subunit|uniref:Carbamoyl phosphate synthase small chain n=2 Tax=Catenisphaera adipataccumulans TaxID=700500 RepID=A0A7W8FUY8_9FIRM|nr:glutamine-hydrolyzing carbamoyl-phosphate synthase small subunit [Catenisphaera adipataccumulans]MBB5182588.1 carbamoyl-phosphate synthase small subunit [Catenisphaera adipataccumulans]
MDRLLILEDGSVYKGTALGSNANFRMGEIVFNTSMTGYQEILTDNSYCGQIIMMTYPLMGNYGINGDDMESIIPAAFGFVVRDYCEYPSNWRSQQTLDDYLKRVNVPGIYGIDTRAITKKIRTQGTMKATLADPDVDVEAVIRELNENDYLHNQVKRVSTTRIYPIPNRGHKVVLMDFGAKLGIVRELTKRNCDLIVVPYDTPAYEIMNFHPDGVMLSNGPGDPEDVSIAIQTIRQLVGKVPMFGICLGHQLIGLACGAKTYKLKFGHRGGNHPVVNLATGRVEITSQNHSFAIDIDSLKDTDLEMTHQALNDHSCEGVRHKKYPIFSVQYHPEASAGPQDSQYLFDEFITMMEKEKEEDHA